MRLNHLDSIVLHVRPYRESSALVDLFTKQRGKVHGLIHGVRGNKAAKFGSDVQPFTEAVVSLSGRGGLSTITQFEATNRYLFSGHNLSAGFYVVELVARTCKEGVSEANIFLGLTEVLDSLRQIDNASADNLHVKNIAKIVRPFELLLLQELGYGVNFGYDHIGEEIEPDAQYTFYPEQGFVKALGPLNTDQNLVLNGSVVLAIGNLDFSSQPARNKSAYVVRACVDAILEGKPLVSRSLW